MSCPSTVLVCHPSTNASAVKAIEVEVRMTAAGEVSLAYRLDGALDRLRIPGPQPAGPADGLWEHTCFEAFIAVEDEPAYREFNFSPSGQWAAYAFSGYRQRDESVPVTRAPRIAVRRSPVRLELDAVLAASLLPPGTGYRLGLSAVVEAADGAKSYWALAHPGPKPDFHRRDAFTLAFPDKNI